MFGCAYGLCVKYRPVFIYFTATAADSHLSLVVRKPAFGVCDQVRQNPARSISEALRRHVFFFFFFFFLHTACSLRNHTIKAANNKGADQTARMLFAHAISRFSHDEAHFIQSSQTDTFSGKFHLSVEGEFLV